MRIVVGYESQDRSGHALAAAHDLATRLGAGLVVVHVRDAVVSAVPSSAVGLPLEPSGAVLSTPLTPEHLAEVRRDVEAEVSAAGATGSEVRVEQGWPPDALQAVADEVDAYLLVVGGQAHGFAAFLEHLVTGSVAHELERRARRPLLVVPAPS
ncbi:MAG: universal stress protein [Mycobacteriales bacterium]|nr:universal stress protein [Mycobacteriales bacterium]